jgi:putative hydrolase of the HAD superfamily
MVSTIIFDLSDVYLGGMFGIEERIATLTGEQVPTNSFHTLPEAISFFHGEITEDVFWQKIIERYYLKHINVEGLKQLVRNQMVEIEGTRSIIERLRDKGYKLGLLSVNAKEWVEHYEKTFDYHRLFHSRLYSFEVGISKPDPKSFELILGKLQVPASECLFIDDYDVNIQSAQALGLQTIQFHTAQQLEEELQKLQILP